jgi:hypothetical protein
LVFGIFEFPNFDLTYPPIRNACESDGFDRMLEEFVDCEIWTSEVELRGLTMRSDFLGLTVLAFWFQGRCGARCEDSGMVWHSRIGHLNV